MRTAHGVAKPADHLLQVLLVIWLTLLAGPPALASQSGYPVNSMAIRAVIELFPL